MKKKIVLILLALFAIALLGSSNYSVSTKTDKNNNFVYSVISRGEQVVARFCLINPDPFYFYSMESDADLFPNIEKNVNILAERKKRGQPVAMILVDFRNQEKIRRPLNFKYLIHYLLLISFAPPYLRQVEILNPSSFSKSFIVEMKIDGKSYYGALELPRRYETNEAKKFIRSIKGAGEISLIIPVLENLPVKLVAFKNGIPVTLYESHPNHQEFSCIFLAGENR